MPFIGLHTFFLATLKGQFIIFDCKPVPINMMKFSTYSIMSGLYKQDPGKCRPHFADMRSPAVFCRKATNGLRTSCIFRSRRPLLGASRRSFTCGGASSTQPPCKSS